jgi:hypothetical protein
MINEPTTPTSVTNLPGVTPVSINTVFQRPAFWDDIDETWDEFEQTWVETTDSTKVTNL